MRSVVALIVALFVLCAGVVGYSTWLSWNEAHQRADNRASAASQVVATNVRWIVELSQQALRRIDEAIGEDLSSASGGAVRDIREAVESLPGSVKAYVVRADGVTLYSTDPQIKPIDIRDREYFSALAQGADFYVSSLMTSRLNGEQIFVFSRRLERGGRFAGAAVVSFDAALLRDVWSSLGLDELSTVSIIRDDGWLVARYPFPEGPLNLAQYELFTVHLAAADEGTYPAISPADGVGRIVGFRRVAGTSLIALSSVSSRSAYASFWRNTGAMVLATTLIAAALAAAAIWVAGLLRRDAQRQTLLIQTLETNRLLFRDIHHRVKNNLQSVQSLVRMQAIPEEVKRDLQGRISAMTAVHEHIYQLDRYAEVSARSLIPAIVEAQIKSFGANVTTSYDIDEVDIDRDHATPLALLLNELVTNALKYAFGHGGGSIRVSLKALEGDRCLFSVSDDGAGFDPDMAGRGLGRRLVDAMTAQLGGEPGFTFGPGATFSAEITVRGAVENLPRAGLAGPAEARK
ncbi:MAG: sensor histidine kinase [Rhizobiaceae bacterium]